MRMKLAAQNPMHVAERALVAATGKACLGVKGTKNVNLSMDGATAEVECRRNKGCRGESKVANGGGGEVECGNGI